MPTLRDLIAAHAPLLILDAASSQIQVGVLDNDGHAAWQVSDGEAGIAIFQCLEKLATNLDHIRGFAFCEGPGSVLGIRSVAMALRTWCVLKPRPVFAYSSLALIAHAIGRADVSIIADARRESWHHYQIGRGLRRLPPSELKGELFLPENFRTWSELPANVARTPYSLVDLIARTAAADVFHATDSPDAFLHEEPSYVTWTPQIHRAPTQR
jgi:tRNA threonylcarbamoyladenosine biosynthesis protein TsaB